MQGPYYLSSRWIMAIQGFTLLVLAVGVLRGGNVIPNYLNLKKSQEVLSQAVKNLEEENKNLEIEAERLQKSPSYAKKVLRDKYHLVEEGERIQFFAD